MKRLLYRAAALVCALMAGWFVVVGVREIGGPNIYEQIANLAFFVIVFGILAVLAWRHS